ncbi:hypothetical protein L596_015228 [Steinernema carpocapsae]|uniref:Transposase Tc1-like domain-containing protein n=1 Tax=Steinernema carpocapsae TaxID=34508 RepID=A0A4V6A322_STECR|nr:hypothetical protein L596_015228 [Steinernema carpocapsae]
MSVFGLVLFFLCIPEKWCRKKTVPRSLHTTSEERETISEIAKLLKFQCVRVPRVVQRSQGTGKIKDRQRNGRPRTSTTPALKKMLKQKIQRNSQKSIRKFDKEQDVSGRTMQNLVRDDLGLKSYKLAKG